MPGPEGDGEDGVVIGDRVAPVGRRIRRRRKKRKAVSLSPRPSLNWNGEGQSGNFGSGSKAVVEDVVDGNQVGGKYEKKKLILCPKKLLFPIVCLWIWLIS